MSALIKKLYTISIVAFMLFGLFACNKSGNVTVNPNRFTWSYNGSAYNAYQYTAFTYSRTFPNVIIAVQGNTLTSFPRCEFTLSSFNPNTYSFNQTGLNIFKYYDTNGNVFEATSGSITITSNSNNLMNGNFAATLTNSSGNKTPISGNFSNMAVVQ